ncbi:hypothetical protein K466DRAFT_582765 [Polyporus arcularius HHB13444]|uniref:Uncharacterized protein n=1 Tax=Polyporus arcularius HHB13444 TaxID=1314778 RepID=A0A5C3PP41_9APHY|nr:hypothetical protein K466DRAFT_582765 [Polyporus arcularius HHB13444]
MSLRCAFCDFGRLPVRYFVLRPSTILQMSQVTMSCSRSTAVETWLTPARTATKWPMRFASAVGSVDCTGIVLARSRTEQAEERNSNRKFSWVWNATSRATPIWRDKG